MSGSKPNTSPLFWHIPYIPFPSLSTNNSFLSLLNCNFWSLNVNITGIYPSFNQTTTYLWMHTCRSTSSPPSPPLSSSLHSAHSMDTDQWHPGPLTSHTTSLPSLMQIRILATNLLSSECLFNGVGRWLFGAVLFHKHSQAPGTGWVGPNEGS